MKRLKLSKTVNVKSWSMKDKDGNVLTKHDEILERWAEFYENLYFDERVNTEKFEEDVSIPPVMYDELVYAINKLKSEKSPGPDSITAEMLKSGGPNLRTALLKLVNLIILERDIPDRLTFSEIITIFKKGARLECENYRPINLLSHIYKLVMQIIYQRISGDLMASLPKTQAAYQPGRSTTEQIQSLQQIIEKCKEFNKKGVICFIDFSKAFDSLHQQKLWNALHKYTTINPAYINLLASLYESSKAHVKTDIGNTRLFNILRGVKQGDLASAILFCIALAVVLIEAFEGTDIGIGIGGVLHTDEGYADDVGLLTIAIGEMNTILERLSISAKRYGLSVNVKKTKVMLLGDHSIENCIPAVKYNNYILKVVEHFEYLGRVLSKDNDDTKAVLDRIGKAWGAFNKVKSVLTSRHLSIESKCKTYLTYVAPSLLYATETMTWKESLWKKINVFENHIMRWILNVRLVDKIKIEELRRRTRLPSIVRTIQARKLTWYGHIKRCDLPVKVLFEGMVEGNCKRVRPCRRWRDNVKVWLGQSWSEINNKVKDREQWRMYVKRVTQSANAEKA